MISSKPIVFMLFVATFFLGSCNNQTKTGQTEESNTEKPREDKQTKEDFGEFYPQFQEDFNLKNVRYLNRYIDEDNGLIVVVSEGAYSLPHYFKTVGEFMQYSGEGEIPAIQKLKITPSPQYGAKPVFDCVNQQWNKTGCFWNEKPNAQFTALYDVLMEHKIIPHDQAIEEQIKTVDALATRLVYDTETNVGFYFNRINGKWYLLCVERILPCK
jgi:hypothetical protein